MTASPLRLTPAKCADELAVLRRLKQQVEVAIGCFEYGFTVVDDTCHEATAHPCDFRIGDFLITDTKRRPL